MNQFKIILSTLLFALAFNLGAMDKSKLDLQLNEKMEQLNLSMQKYQAQLNKALLESSQYNDIGHIKQLINLGADVDATNEYGCTPLFIAAYYRSNKTAQIKTIQELINAGADINKANNNGDTPLHNAALHGYKKIVSLLIDAGCQLNKINKWGYTPLLRATFQSRSKIAQILIDSGANINIANHDGETPLSSATFDGNKKNTFLLLNHGTTINDFEEQRLLMHFTPLQIAIAQGDTQKTLSILQKISSILGRDDIYITKELLEIPAICGDVYMMSFLLQFNPNEEALKHAFLTIEKETDGKSMMIKTMLTCWHHIQEQIKQTSNAKEKVQLRTKFYDMMLQAAVKYNQLDLFFCDQEPGKFKEYIIHHIGHIVETRQHLQ